MNQTLSLLKGPDRIRKRPQVAFRGGAQDAVKGLILVFLREALLGHCHSLYVRQDGLHFVVKAVGRGMYIGQDAIDSSRWKNIFCEFYAGPKFCLEQKSSPFDIDDSHRALFGEKPFAEEDFYYLDLYALNCVSRVMKITVHRNGVESQLHFEKGVNIGGMVNSQTSEPDCNTFEFEIDEEIFPGAVIPKGHILETLKGYALRIPGFRCANGETISFYYSEGHPKLQKGKVGI